LQDKVDIEEEEKQFELILDYFKNKFIEKRQTRDQLMKLSANTPKWKFSGNTNNIFTMTEALFKFEPSEISRFSIVGIPGGSGKHIGFSPCKFYFFL
jgi:glucosamine 6-phosphate synthetase-like amidotransferase/phosphosugar isomerase protein